MNYISIYSHTSRKRLAFLENAYKIGYRKPLNALWTAHFTLPATDRKNEYCQPFNYVELYDEDEYIGLFRIVPSELVKNINTHEITYQCEHVLATLLDDVMVGWHEVGNLGVYTNQVIQYVLDQQTTKNWVLNECEFNRQFLYGWEHENLLSALLSIPKPFTAKYQWVFDTRNWPWVLSLKAQESETITHTEEVLVGTNYTEPPYYDSKLSGTAQVYNGVTITQNDGKITLNGSSTGESSSWFYIGIRNRSEDIPLSQGTYRIKFHKSGALSSSGGLFQIVAYETASSSSGYAVVSANIQSLDDMQFVWPERYDGWFYSVNFWWHGGGDSFNNFSITPEMGIATDFVERSTVERKIIKAKGEIRYAKNMIGITKVVDATDVCTRLYAFGYGEGVDALNLSKINPTGRLYIDSDTQDKYGIISKIWVDRRYQVPQSLWDAANALLEKLKEPKVTYTVESAHIGSLRNCDVGDIVRVIDDEEEISEYFQIQCITKDDVTGNPAAATLVLGGDDESTASSIADISDRQRIEETYAQGAVTLYSQSFRDNAGADNPAEMRFYIPQNVVHLNQIILHGKLTAFRGYTKATKGGGASSSTTTDGGSTTETTTSGGGATVTSAAGGSSTVTSASGGGGTYTSPAGGGASSTSGSGGSVNTSTANTGGSSYPTSASSISMVTDYAWTGGWSNSGNGRSEAYTYYSGSPSHQHKYYWPADHSHYVDLGSHRHSIPSHTHGIVLATHSHSVSIGSHSHSVTIPNHSHSVTIGSHSHSVTIGSHSHSVTIQAHSHSVTIKSHNHNFSIPDHTHDIEYGIYQGDRASSVEIAVDDNVVGTFSSIDDINLIPFLSADDEGLVDRGWHTVTVTPDALTRIELDLVIQLFANSRGGGQY